jgi:hypothetical protein
MITKEHYLEISEKYGEFASWAVWADEDKKPKSNIGDLNIFDLNSNPSLLQLLNPNIIMVGLNFSRTIYKDVFINFHDKRPQGQDYKIRYAFRNTPFYGAYMTDIIKDFEEKVSGNVLSYLNKNREFEIENIKFFKQEMIDLKCENPLIIAFGNIVFELLKKHFGETLNIIKVIHYSHHVNLEKYRNEVLKSLKTYE